MTAFRFLCAPLKPNVTASGGVFVCDWFAAVNGLHIVSVGVDDGVPNWPVCGQLSVVGNVGLCWSANEYVSELGT